MSLLLAFGRSLPRSYRRMQSGLNRRLRMRRRWPRPDHFDRMTDAQIRSYVQSIGLDEEIDAALAEYEGVAAKS